MPVFAKGPRSTLRKLKCVFFPPIFLITGPFCVPLAMPLDTSANPAETAPFRLERISGMPTPQFVAMLFGALISLQAAGYLVLGTGRAGMAFSEVLLVLHNLLAMTCAGIAFRRARGVTALFWLLFLVTLFVLLIPAAILAVSTIGNWTLLSSATWRVLFCLYGTPILMMLFVPASNRDERHKLEVYLDLFQVTIVSSLGFYTFFYLPLQGMLAEDALLRNLDLSNWESAFLLLVALARMWSVRVQDRDPLIRLALFILFCALVTFIGNWIDAHHFLTVSAWWDLGWALPLAAAGLVAITWRPAAQTAPEQESWPFLRLVGKNLVLIALLVSIRVIMDNWAGEHQALVSNLVVAAFLVAFSVRLALTQFYQRREIAQRKQIQDELFAANETISGLLEESRVDANSIAQISQLSSVLQSCSSRQDAFRILPEWLARIFPATCGLLSVLNPARTHAETAARWGDGPPVPQSLGPGAPASNTETVIDDPGSPTRPQVTIPLIAHGDPVGVLVLQGSSEGLAGTESSSTREFSRQTQLGYSVAEHLALTITNLDLRERLRLEAIRDPLTGLYNRRHMQEALDREIHRARRRARSFALVMLDLDHFKRYNDSFGHAAGDQALRLTAEKLLHNVRAEDLACRYGGEELVVLMPECTLDQAAARAEQIRACIKQLHSERAGELPAEITVSIGVAAFPETADDAALLFKAADGALYEAKHAGRDRVVVARPIGAATASVS